jgi:hypothetical protein
VKLQSGCRQAWTQSGNVGVRAAGALDFEFRTDVIARSRSSTPSLGVSLWGAAYDK